MLRILLTAKVWNCLFLAGILFCTACQPPKEMRVLVFSKTEGFRHASIEAGQAALMKLGEQHGIVVDTTEDASLFTEAQLQPYSAIIFLNTTGDVLNFVQQIAFQRYIQAGGGFVGIHAATDTEYDWPWYGRLVGAYFTSHPNNPNVRDAKMQVVNVAHPSTRFFGSEGIWERTDEFYNFRSIYYGQPDGIIPLVQIDENSYEGGTNGAFHPMSWYHEYDGGRAFYTNFGHTAETFSEEKYLKHLMGGIEYAIGDNEHLDYSRCRTPAHIAPEANRFVMTVLDEGLNEPEELDFLPNGNVLFVERRGALKIHDIKTRQTRTLATLDVYTEKEDGLVGLALDPNYAENNWIYLYYSPPTEAPKFQLSRFELKGEKLVKESEKIMLEVVVQREECCHTGGSIQFDDRGLLYLSTGDDTNPFDTRYAPIDERPGRGPWDAQKSSANTQDLRGKILRIQPTADGGYEIPEGNLFADPKEGRPEIYVMGCRNPYRISIDSKTGYVYWGDVGPDGQVDSTRGPRGYDEVNQARQPGFFGWPLFIGDNKPYRDVDFATQTLGDWFDPEAPINNSPHNTGIQQLPPAQPAFIWYPYSDSKEFPIVGKGGRNAMAGPVYYADRFEGIENRFPAYYEGRLFIYDFMRDWIFTVKMDPAGDLEYLEPFMPELSLSSPMDMEFGPDGALYLLEYGTTWFKKNTDARLIRIAYHEGNRSPIAKLTADQTVGAAPLTVQFTAAESFDFDEAEALRYEWIFADETVAEVEGATATHTFDKPGIYRPAVRVIDPAGNQARAEVIVQVGNAPPQLTVQWEGNRSFMWPERPVPYQVSVSDQEDGSLDKGILPEAVAITFDYLQASEDATEQAQDHAAVASASLLAVGEALISDAGCIACHGIDKAIVGPGYREVAERYKHTPDVVAYLTRKILEGGNGVWGEVVMPAQAQLDEGQASSIASYIMSLNKSRAQAETLPASGTLRAEKKQGAGDQYIFTATYQDRGGQEIGPLRSTETIRLRAPMIEAESLDRNLSKGFQIRGNEQLHAAMGVEGYFCYPGWDLSGISEVQIRYAAIEAGHQIELRLDAPDGPILTSWQVSATGSTDRYKLARLSFTPAKGVHDLYLVARPKETQQRRIIRIDWFYFRPPGQTTAMRD